MEKRFSDKELDNILRKDFLSFDMDYTDLLVNLAGDLKEERSLRQEIESRMKQLENLLNLLRDLQDRTSTLNLLKESINTTEAKLTVDTPSHHHSIHEKIIACSVWLLLRSKSKKIPEVLPPNFNELRENLLEIQTEGHWPGEIIPSSITLKNWHKKYNWEKIFSDYFFNFLMNKGFGVEIDYNEFIPELYKRWEEEIKTIDDDPK